MTAMRLKIILVLASLVICGTMIFLAIHGLGYRPKKFFKPSLVQSYCKMGTLIARNLFSELGPKKVLFWGDEGFDSQIRECFLKEYKQNNIEFKVIDKDQIKNIDVVKSDQKYVIYDDVKNISHLEPQSWIKAQSPGFQEATLSVYFSRIAPGTQPAQECFVDGARAQTLGCLNAKKSLEIEHKSKGKLGEWTAGDQVHKNDFLIYFMKL